jgi:hypothetical protein
MQNPYIGMAVRIGISDPWDMGEDLGWPALDADIVAARDDDPCEHIIVRLREPFRYEEVDCEYFAASPRLEGDSFVALLRGKSVFSALTRIPPERLNTADPFDLSWWRGGVGIIGNVEPAVLSSV